MGQFKSAIDNCNSRIWKDHKLCLIRNTSPLPHSNQSCISSFITNYEVSKIGLTQFFINNTTSLISSIMSICNIFFSLNPLMSLKKYNWLMLKSYYHESNYSLYTHRSMHITMVKMILCLYLMKYIILNVHLSQFLTHQGVPQNPISSYPFVYYPLSYQLYMVHFTKIT